MKNIISLLTLIVCISSCNKEETLISLDYLINENGWYTYEMTRTDLIDGTGFTTESPYIILNEYGSGFKIKEDGVCHISYSEGDQAIREGEVTRMWELTGDGKIIFTSQISMNINATIIELTANSLWIQYETAGDNWEYKLRRIE